MGPGCALGRDIRLQGHRRVIAADVAPLNMYGIATLSTASQSGQRPADAIIWKRTEAELSG